MRRCLWQHTDNKLVSLDRRISIIRKVSKVNTLKVAVAFRASDQPR